MADHPWERGALVLAAAAVVLLVGIPLAELIRAALHEGAPQALAAIRGGAGGQAVANTLWTGAAVTAAAIVAGTAAAVVTERTDAPAREALRLAVLLPLVVPGFVAALGWSRAYGTSGLLDDIAGLALPGLHSGAGVFLVLTVEAVPIAYLVAAGALASRREADAERAARSSGATPAEMLRTVTVPLLRPALAGASALVFVTSVNAFGVPAVLGTPAGFSTVTTRIYADLTRSADPAAFTRAIVLSAGLVLLTGAVVALANAAGTGRAVRGPAAPVEGDRIRGRGAGWVLWMYALLTAGVPLLALVLAALTRAAGLAPVPANWTPANFTAVVQPGTLAALLRSIGLAAGAACAVTLLAGLLVGVRERRAGRALGTLSALTFAVPGSALAVALLLAYGPALRDTLALILLAYVAKFWALGHRPLEGSVDAIPPDLFRAARASGAEPATVARTIALPLLRPALAAGWLVVFLFGLHELTMSSLLYGPESQTLAVVILNVTQLGDVTVTSALAVVLTAALLALSAVLLGVRRWQRSLA